MDNTLGADHQRLREAQATAATPDPVTAELLQKHGVGEKLTPQQYGRIGAFARRLKTLVTGPARTDGAASRPAEPGPAPGNPADLDTVAPGETSLARLEPVPVDAGVARRVTAAVLTRADAITVRYVEGQARRTVQAIKLEESAAAKTIARFRATAAFSPDDRTLLTDLAPDVLAELGLDPRRYALYTVGGVLGLHITNVWLAVEELKQMARDAKGSAPAATPAAAIQASNSTPGQA